MGRCRKDLHDFDNSKYLQCPFCKKVRQSSPNERLKAVLSARRWRKQNPKLASFYKKSRRIAQMQRTPKWLSKEEKLAIKQFYLNCPKDYHVDHIVPLRGETISGLHVLSNLQYLPGVENLIKGNKYE